MSYEASLAAFRQGDDALARDIAAADLAAAQASRDAKAQVDALCMLARVALRAGELDQVRAQAEAAQQVAMSIGDERLGRMPLHLRAVAARMSGQLETARELYLNSIALNDRLGERVMAAAEHRNLAYVEIRAGDAARARELFAESRERFAGLDAPAMRPYLTFDAATLAALAGDYDAAAANLHAAQAEWAAQGVEPDPDDAAEISALRQQLVQVGVEAIR
jgi:hypothetical protein